MKGYQVKYKKFGNWYVDSDTNGTNLMYAECVAKYYRDRGIEVEIINLDAKEAANDI